MEPTAERLALILSKRAEDQNPDLWPAIKSCFDSRKFEVAKRPANEESPGYYEVQNQELMEMTILPIEGRMVCRAASRLGLKVLLPRSKWIEKALILSDEGGFLIRPREERVSAEKIEGIRAREQEEMFRAKEAAREFGH